MINIDYLHEEIAKILRLRVPVDIPILQQGQSNPPEDNWVSYRLTDWKQQGEQWEQYVDEDLDSVDYATDSLWKVTLNILTVGIKSDQLAVDLAHQFNKSFYLDSFEVLGLAYLSKDVVRHTPYRLATGWEQRHQFNVYFNITVSDTDEIDFIDKIEITHEVIGETGTVLYTDTEEYDI
jgi:hypothetical protein